MHAHKHCRRLGINIEFIKQPLANYTRLLLMLLFVDANDEEEEAYINYQKRAVFPKKASNESTRT